MTTATMALAELAEKGADVDVLRQMVQFMAQRLMELDVEQRCGAGYDEKTAERLNSRNGYRERAWDTRAGSVELKIPKLRQGSYFPEFLEPRRTAEKALTAVIQEAYIQGISTRSVDELVKSLGMSGVSKSQVSRLCGELDERVGAFLNRQIEGDWPYLWIDATYVKTREAGRIVSVAVIVAVGVNTDGHYYRHADDSPGLACLDVGRVDPQVRPVAFDLAIQEGADPLVELAAQPADLALGDAAHAERLDQLIHRAGGDALDVGLLNHGGEGLLGRAPRLQELGEVAALAQLGDLQLDTAGARVPRSLAVAVAAVQPLGGLLVVAGTAALLDVELHQALGHELHHLAQHVDVGSLLGELGKCHSGGGHRVFPSDQGGWIAPQPYPGSRWPPRSGRPAAVRQAASGYALRASPRTERLTPLPGTSPKRTCRSAISTRPRGIFRHSRCGTLLRGHHGLSELSLLPGPSRHKTPGVGHLRFLTCCSSFETTSESCRRIAVASRVSGA